MSGLVFLVVAWNCWISYKNGYAGLLALAASLEPLAHCRNGANLKVVSATLLLVYFVCLKERTFETKKNELSLRKLFSFLR